VFCNIEIWQEMLLEVSSPPGVPSGMFSGWDGTRGALPTRWQVSKTDGWLAGRKDVQ
jgi:hypothetical protein